ncbi:hypothetical protein [Campylobacter hyointestinalis]|uniref:hypothetical protein n=1 Tax=Campylobacter hyointestinalis TaxID=198 RepID=UPI00164D6AD8|nr:hypothetical protein [Campylobacter hyointestinalis]
MKKSLVAVLAVFSLVNAEKISIGGTSFERVDALEACDLGHQIACGAYKELSK